MVTKYIFYGVRWICNRPKKFDFIAAQNSSKFTIDDELRLRQQILKTGALMYITGYHELAFRNHLSNNIPLDRVGVILSSHHVSKQEVHERAN